MYLITKELILFLKLLFVKLQVGLDMRRVQLLRR